jgi:hypothetical protein
MRHLRFELRGKRILGLEDATGKLIVLVGDPAFVARPRWQRRERPQVRAAKLPAQPDHVA